MHYLERGAVHGGNCIHISITQLRVAGPGDVKSLPLSLSAVKSPQGIGLWQAVPHRAIGGHMQPVCGGVLPPAPCFWGSLCPKSHSGSSGGRQGIANLLASLIPAEAFVCSCLENIPPFWVNILLFLWFCGAGARRLAPGAAVAAGGTPVCAGL